MADKRDPITGTLDAEEVSADNYIMPADGLFRGDLEWTAGTMTVRLNIKIPGGDAYVPAYDASGNAITFDMATGKRHASVEVIAQAGTGFQWEATASSSGDVNHSGGRVGDR